MKSISTINPAIMENKEWLIINLRYSARPICWFKNVFTAWLWCITMLRLASNSSNMFGNIPCKE